MDKQTLKQEHFESFHQIFQLGLDYWATPPKSLIGMDMIVTTLIFFLIDLKYSKKEIRKIMDEHFILEPSFDELYQIAQEFGLQFRTTLMMGFLTLNANPHLLKKLPANAVYSQIELTSTLN